MNNDRTPVCVRCQWEADRVRLRVGEALVSRRAIREMIGHMAVATGRHGMDARQVLFGALAGVLR